MRGVRSNFGGELFRNAVHGQVGEGLLDFCSQSVGDGRSVGRTSVPPVGAAHHKTGQGFMATSLTQNVHYLMGGDGSPRKGKGASRIALCQSGASAPGVDSNPYAHPSKIAYLCGMVLPIVAYGDPVLKKKASPVDVSDPSLPTLVENLFETMYHAHGVGLAAPQVGLSLRLFVVDGSPFAEDSDFADQAPVLKNYKRAFYNPEVLEESGELWGFEEGCLSIPDVHETVHRKSVVRFKHQLLDGTWEEMELSGLAARVFQHEYDHIEGVLFTDRLSALRKRMLQGRLGNIAKGLISVGYRMKFPAAR